MNELLFSRLISTCKSLTSHRSHRIHRPQFAAAAHCEITLVPHTNCAVTHCHAAGKRERYARCFTSQTGPQALVQGRTGCGEWRQNQRGELNAAGAALWDKLPLWVVEVVMQHPRVRGREKEWYLHRI